MLLQLQPACHLRGAFHAPDGAGYHAGAGFYLDATVPKWDKYRMYSYISSELLQLLRTQAPMLDMTRLAVMGHSMGGHGAPSLTGRSVAPSRSLLQAA